MQTTSLGFRYNMAPKPQKNDTESSDVLFQPVRYRKLIFPASSQAHACVHFHRRDIKHSSTYSHERRFLRSMERQRTPEKPGTAGSVHLASPCRCVGARRHDRARGEGGSSPP